MTNINRAVAEFLGTFWLVFAGCGSAIYAATFPDVGIGFLGVALAFGLSIISMTYAVGSISGAHFNPAVTIGLWASGRFPLKNVPIYIIAQVIGGIVGAYVLYAVAVGAPDYALAINGANSNGYAEGSLGGYSIASAFIAEVLLTFFFLTIIIGATSKKAPAALAPLAIGLAYTVIHLIAIPITNASINPARSTGPALVEGGLALQQLWLFWVAPIIGGGIGGLLSYWLHGED